MSGSETIDVDEKLVRGALQSVISDPNFAGAKRLREFLTYIVDEFVAGRGDRISGKTIAQDVYERSHLDGGDSENIVRVDARRLRQSLALYYETGGKEDPVRIHLDTGAYRPRFEILDPQKKRFSTRFREIYLVPATALIFGLVIGIGGYSILSPRVSPPTEVAESASSRLDGDPRRTAILQKSPRALQAVNLANQGRAMIAPMFDRRRQEIVSEVFLHAVELDGTYFGGYAGAAQAFVLRGLTSPPGPEREELLSRAGEYAQKAQSLGPAEGWTQSALGWVALASGDAESAVELSRRAVQLSPDDGYVLDHHGLITMWAGSFEEAVAVSGRATNQGGKLERYMSRNIFGASSFHLGNYRESVESFEDVGRFGDPLSAPTLVYYAASLVKLGRLDEAREKVEELMQAWPRADVDVLMKGVHADDKNAEAVLELLYQVGWERPSAD